MILLLFLSGFRQEQDIYVRLIDSVSKQVTQPSLLLDLLGPTSPFFAWQTGELLVNQLGMVSRGLCDFNSVALLKSQPASDSFTAGSFTEVFQWPADFILESQEQTGRLPVNLLGMVSRGLCDFNTAASLKSQPAEFH